MGQTTHDLLANILNFLIAGDWGGMGVLGRLRLTALRRKSVILCLLTGLVLVVLCLQYNSAVRNEASDRPQRDADRIMGIGDIFQRGRAASVQFLRVSAIRKLLEIHSWAGTAIIFTSSGSIVFILQYIILLQVE